MEETTSQTLRTLWRDAKQAMRRRDYRGTLAVLDGADTLHPDDPYIPAFLGQASVGLGEWDQAIRYHETATRLAPQNAEMWGFLAYARRYGGDLAGAVDAQRRAYTLSPRDVEAAATLGEILVEAGSEKEAVDVYGAALALDPAARQIRYSLASALSCHDPCTARELLEKQRAPDLDTLLLLADCCVRTGHVAAGKRAVSKAMGLAPDEWRVLIVAGDVAFAQLRWREGLALYRRSYEQHPSIRAALGYARVATWLNRLDDARPLVADACSRFPDCLPLKCEQADILAAVGRRAEAIASVEALVAAHPDRYDLKCHLSRLLLGGWDIRGSVRMFRSALKTCQEQSSRAANLEPIVRRVVESGSSLSEKLE